ncbi:Choline-sulfatase [Pontiella sulfatireligans]|uniref:Choline-sulfatase n=2 Tax=Pontiella sulfatireligans TaxID=2750658 RepID=A0A6C2UKU0_9BACT|nr:sulfatase S1_7 [Kiritimatiellales bacterium]VGO20855.1 Choline-sulfatase [Pontiella sulfatireligans]
MKKQMMKTTLLMLGGLLMAGSASAKPLNVLFITIDDLRPEIGCYVNDEVKTPNIDRLAKMGVKFNKAYSQYPVCNPSRASFLSGKRPDELGIVSNMIPLREKWPDIVTLPQLFRENGYFTAGMGKLLHMGLDENGLATHFRDDLSFEHQFKALDSSPKIGKKGEGRKLGDGSIVWAYWRAAEGGDEAQPDGMLAAEAVRVLEENHDQPFFIGVGFHKPHDPFVAPKEYFEGYPLDEVKLAKEPKDRTPLLRYSLSDKDFFSSFTEQDQKEFKRAYHACVTFTDAQVGKIFEVMDRHKLWDNTIVLLMGDHGYHLGERGWWNKVTVFECGARAPLMMWVPGMESMGQETDSVIEFLDIYPTLVDLCGLKAPHALSGKTMRSVLQNPSKDWRKSAYTQVTRGNKMMGYSVRDGRYRYIQWGVNGEGGAELYDHEKDDGEYYNLADHPEYKKTQKKMAALLKDGYPTIK